jgi:hypothetical protein
MALEGTFAVLGRVLVRGPEQNMLDYVRRFPDGTYLGEVAAAIEDKLRLRNARLYALGAVKLKDVDAAYADQLLATATPLDAEDRLASDIKVLAVGEPIGEYDPALCIPRSGSTSSFAIVRQSSEHRRAPPFR